MTRHAGKNIAPNLQNMLSRISKTLKKPGAIRLPLVIAALLPLLVNCDLFPPEEASISVDPSQEHQTMTGWEATAQSGETTSAAFGEFKNELFNYAVNDLGINRLRLEVRSGEENPSRYFSKLHSGQITNEEFKDKRYEIINDNDDPFEIESSGFDFAELDLTLERVVIPIRALLAQRGETLYLNLTYVDFGSGRGVSNMRHHTNPEEYAEFMLAVFLHIRGKFGFVPDSIEIILEPDNGTGWTGKDIGNAIIATANRLQKHNFTPAFIVPSTKRMDAAVTFIDQISEIPGAMQFVSEVSYHRYGGVSTQALQDIAERALKFGKKTSMLEKIGAGYDALHADLKIGRNSAWQQYTIGFPNEPDNGAQYFLIDDRNVAEPKVAIGSRTTFLRQYFRNVRAGARRIGAETTNSKLDPLAFINTNGKYVVVIKADAAGKVGIQGLPDGSYGISYTTKSRSDANAGDLSIKTGERLSTEMPAAGVMTIFQR